jgi:hypothetical protein
MGEAELLQEVRLAVVQWSLKVVSSKAIDLQTPCDGPWLELGCDGRAGDERWAVRCFRRVAGRGPVASVRPVARAEGTLRWRSAALHVERAYAHVTGCCISRAGAGRTQPPPPLLTTIAASPRAPLSLSRSLRPSQLPSSHRRTFVSAHIMDVDPSPTAWLSSAKASAPSPAAEQVIGQLEAAYNKKSVQLPLAVLPEVD